ncbi:unnamed protein product, partial [Heterosigma akashiwo]
MQAYIGLGTKRIFFWRQMDHLELIVPAVSVGGVVLIVAIYAFSRRCCCRHRGGGRGR